MYLMKKGLKAFCMYHVYVSCATYLCDRKVPPKLKGKFNRVMVRPTMLPGTECWPVKLSRAEDESCKNQDILSSEFPVRTRRIPTSAGASCASAQSSG